MDGGVAETKANPLWNNEDGYTLETQTAASKLAWDLGAEQVTESLTQAIFVSATNLGADLEGVEVTQDNLGKALGAIRLAAFNEGFEKGEASVTFLQSSYDAGHEAGVASIMDSPLWNNEDGVSQADVDAAIKAVNATLPGIIADATQEGIDLAKAK